MAERVQQAPYGDIVYAGTPKLDQMGAFLYNQERQREVMRQRKGEQLDAMMNASASKLRDADIEGYYDKYNTYKQAWMDLQKTNPKGREFLEKQTAMNRLKADMDAYGSRSIQERELEKAELANMIKNPDDYEDDAMDFMTERARTPFSKFKFTMPVPKTGQTFEIDLGDIQGNTRYKGVTSDFSKDLLRAKGSLNQRGEQSSELIENGLTRNVGTIKAYNSPAEYATNLLTGIVGSKKARDFDRFKPYTDEQAQNILNQFDQLKQTPAYKQAYGNSGDIPQQLLLTPAGRTAALMAMENAISNPPTVTYRKEPVYSAREKAKNAEWSRRDSINHEQAKKLIALNKANGRPADEGLQHPFDRAEANYGIHVGGKTYIPYEALSSSEMAKFNPFDKNKMLIPVAPIEIEVDGQKKRVFERNSYGDLVGQGGRLIKGYDAAVEAVSDLGSKDKRRTVGDMLNKPKPAADPVFNMK